MKIKVKVVNVLLSTVQAVGVAEEGGERAGFFVTVTPTYVALSAEPNQLGLKLIDEFSEILGKPTLKYRDRRGDYEDYTAEWFLLKDMQNVENVLRRVKQHLALGFEPEELE